MVRCLSPELKQNWLACIRWLALARQHLIHRRKIYLGHEISYIYRNGTQKCYVLFEAGLFLPYLRELISNSEICRSFNDLSMVYAFNSPNIAGLISGASSRIQIQETIRSFRSFSQFDTSELYRDLLNFQQNRIP